MKKTFGGKIWSLVQYACILYAGQKIYSLMQQGYTNKRNEMDARKHNSDKVDLASEESFPASDPPAWGAGHVVGPTR